MALTFVGEIKLFAGSFAPAGYLSCDGQLLPISQYDVLFALIGTTYGGDGQTTFALPDLRGRIPIHQGLANVQGQAAGSETVSLLPSQLPAHGHDLRAGAAGAKANSAAGAYFASGGPQQYISGRVSPTGVLQGGLSTAGGGQPHQNMMPFTAMTFIIATEGIFPSPN